MATIILSEMTIQSLFNMSNIPYEPNQSFEEKVTILKNANVLQKDQNYSNHTELSPNDIRNTPFIGCQLNDNSFDNNGNILPKMKEGKWEYNRTYYYIDDLKIYNNVKTTDLVGPKSYQVEIFIENLPADFCKATVISTDYKAILNVAKIGVNIFIVGSNLVDDRTYFWAPTVIKNGVIHEAEGVDFAMAGVMLLDGGIKARSYSKIYLKYNGN